MKNELSLFYTSIRCTLVHMLVGAPDVALQILAVCRVVVVVLVLTKNSFGFLAHLQQRAFCLACSHKEQAQVTDQ